MNINDLQPAKNFARNFGIKSIVYGKPGSGKTPLVVGTAPRPVLLISEPGTLTLRDSEVPAWEAYTPAAIAEFFQWFFNSTEADNFDSLIWDSVSQGAEIHVEHELNKKSNSGNKVNGMAAYGEMARTILDYLNKAYFMPKKHVFLIAKLQNHEVNDAIYKRPYFPGKELPVRVPHLYDLIMEMGEFVIPGHGKAKAFRTTETFDAMGRDRSGRLSEYEPPDIAALITKCLS